MTLDQGRDLMRFLWSTLTSPTRVNLSSLFLEFENGRM